MIHQEYVKEAVVPEKDCLADVVLRSAVGCWFFVTFVGQWLFMYYVLALYGGPTMSGHFEGWTRKTTLFKGYIPGDIVGNLTFAAHVMFAAVFSFGGVIQLLPQIRQRAIALHRWNGRAFLVAAVMISSGGLYMVWVRDARFNWVGAISVSLNAVFILVFVAMTWRAVRMHDIDSHRRWALRTFMVANGPGVWVRVTFAGWYVFTSGLGTTGKMDGPMNYFFAFATYLLPLAVLELYLRVRASASAIARFATAAVVVALTAYMIVGTLVAALSRSKIL